MKRSRARSGEAIGFARTQSATANDFAETVWQLLRNRRCCGQKFRREFPIPPYIVDFCCVELHLVIEIDGKAYFTDSGTDEDRRRDQYLNQLGYKILRIKGYEVLREDGNVLERIPQFVQSATES